MADTPGAGDRAPDFSLTSDEGKTVRLSELLERKTVVVYFYPKDDTPGCTVESCTFRDSYQDFVDAGAEVVGISSDSQTAHERFKSKHRLPFVLLSDPGGVVRKRYGAEGFLGLLPGRVTFVIDRKGVIRYRFSSQLKVKDHVHQALELVRALEPDTMRASGA